jgi:DnaJ-class molecular chaperone
MKEKQPFMFTSRGDDVELPAIITLREAYEGTTYPVTLNGTPKNVVIPAGVMTGTKIRVRGAGEPSPDGGLPGDLFLVIDVDRDDVFIRDYHDLKTEIIIDLITATHGGSVDVPTMTIPAKLKIPAGIMTGSLLRIPGRGMPIMKKGTYGDLYVRVYIDPSELLRSR